MYKMNSGFLYHAWGLYNLELYVVIVQIYFFINIIHTKPQTKLRGKLCTFV